MIRSIQSGEETGGEKTMRIAVCENSPESAERLRDWIQQFCILYQVPAVLECFSSPDGFAEEPEPFDIVYMGFGGSSGFSQARQLRDRDRECRIILVDDTPEFAIRGMRLHCVDFILRPVQFRNVVRSMGLALGRRMG